MTAEEFVALLAGATSTGPGKWKARCPAHDDRRPSLTVGTGDDNRPLVRCHAGCETKQVVAVMGLSLRDLFPGLTLAAYAAAKRLPIPFLQDLGLREVYLGGRRAVAMPYRDLDGHEIAVRFRLALTGDNFRWRRGSATGLGLDRLALARQRGAVLLVEGESDAQTIWFHKVPALGLPGANVWKEAWAGAFDGLRAIYVVIEPDAGGQAVRKWLATSAIRERVRLVTMPDGLKDVSALYLESPERFRARFAEAVNAAVPWTDRAAAEAHQQRDASWAACQSLAQTPQILDALAGAIAQRGVVGEQQAAQLLYLIAVSRLLEHPVSAAVKGPSSAGKSYVEQNVLEFFPPSAFYTLTGMSEKAFAYSEAPLKYRLLVIYEAAGLHSEFASLLVRSLLSEGKIRYETVIKSKDGPKPLLIEREGPTSLVVTTTQVRLHPENETRLLSVPVDDTPAQTRRILDALGDRYHDGETSAEAVDLAPWHTLQEWLATGDNRVMIPFAPRLVAQIPPVAVRLRRDVGAVLRLVQAHALLHQATRARDATGQIVATIDDYGIVRTLVADLIAEGAERTISAAVRETVEAAKTLLDVPGTTEVTITAIARALQMDYSAVHRRVHQAIDREFLKNHETQERRPARLTLGESLPEPATILPMPETLREGGEGGTIPPSTHAHRHTPGGPDEAGYDGVRGQQGGSTSPPPPSPPEPPPADPPPSDPEPERRPGNPEQPEPPREEWEEFRRRRAARDRRKREAAWAAQASNPEPDVIEIDPDTLLPRDSPEYAAYAAAVRRARGRR
jgi:hypothetical protein